MPRRSTPPTPPDNNEDGKLALPEETKPTSRRRSAAPGNEGQLAKVESRADLMHSADLECIDEKVGEVEVDPAEDFSQIASAAYDAGLASMDVVTHHFLQGQAAGVQRFNEVARASNQRLLAGLSAVAGNARSQHIKPTQPEE